MQDKIIRCQNCGQEFAWTKQDQVYCQQKGLLQPNLCLICRSLVESGQKDQFRGKSEFDKK